MSGTGRASGQKSDAEKGNRLGTHAHSFEPSWRLHITACEAPALKKSEKLVRYDEKFRNSSVAGPERFL
jgi:hypothetical protein